MIGHMIVPLRHYNATGLFWDYTLLNRVYFRNLTSDSDFPDSVPTQLTKCPLRSFRVILTIRVCVLLCCYTSHMSLCKCSKQITCKTKRRLIITQDPKSLCTVSQWIYKHDRLRLYMSYSIRLWTNLFIDRHCYYPYSEFKTPPSSNWRHQEISLDNFMCTRSLNNE